MALGEADDVNLVYPQAAVVRPARWWICAYFTHRIILSGVMMAMTALITLVGFELLVAQGLPVCAENAVRGGDIYAR